eukprot:TRINITY_DN4820_c0_g1_i1.p1 TRINITY_DN4820_c0_g1~~TRINITY_DN4820_c0_g1_i1.p1  ORF type:complete len:438 (+),score=107.32 TRINITY_DN4820_c0_g1_i1:111-1316(+)
MREIKEPLFKGKFKNIKYLFLGRNTTYLLTFEGDLMGFGSNTYGNLAIGNFVPKVIKEKIMGDVHEVSGGGNWVVVKKKNGDIFTWGRNDQGQLGYGNQLNQNIPKQILIGQKVNYIACGGVHAFYIMGDNSILAVGRNDFGQLGVGDFVDYYTPTKVGFQNINKIFCGYKFSFFQNRNGEVFSCGDNGHGQCCLGDKEERNIPEKIQNLGDVNYICGGMYHTFILLRNGDLFSCGYNGVGQLGLGKEVKEVAVPTLLMNNVKAVSCGSQFAFVVKYEENKQKIFAFGENYSSQLSFPCKEEEPCIFSPIQIFSGEEITLLPYLHYSDMFGWSPKTHLGFDSNFKISVNAFITVLKIISISSRNSLKLPKPIILEIIKFVFHNLESFSVQPKNLITIKELN